MVIGWFYNFTFSFYKLCHDMLILLFAQYWEFLLCWGSYILSVTGCCHIFIFSCVTNSHRKSCSAGNFHQWQTHFGVRTVGMLSICRFILLILFFGGVIPKKINFHAILVSYGDESRAFNFTLKVYITW